MSSERWRQLEEIFQTALDLSADERASYITAACAGDDELRRQVEALIAQHDEAGDFLDEPLYERSGVQSLAALMDDDPVLGQRIGAYRVLRQIGRGGMGAVYLAERADNAFQKRVAIKLIKRGMDTDFILRRFRHERQILAALDHPFIARLLDGGATTAGQPYFVMEYIEGEPLYQHCDTRRLALRERQRLFCQICEAVEYAHQKQVIHRDIKPSNILVNSAGVPKLFDFGIAKLLDPELAPNTGPQTATTMRMMTVEYSSPEQVQGLPVTYLTDVYSLGVLLYELLTGHRPYHFGSRQLHEMARVIAEQEPELPSMVVTHADDLLPEAGAEFEVITVERACELRQETPAGLSRELTRNLDRIIMKALRKETRERYQSVSALREDIMRHLEGRTVSAPVYAPAAAAKPHIRSAEIQSTGAKSIAVLPLKILNLNPNTDTGDKFMSVGLADALITKLSGVRRLAVRPTSAVLRYGDEGCDPVEAGRELGVDFVLDGRIKIVGERIRVSLQLLDIESGTSIWANQFDERHTDVLELEDSISARVAEALLPELTEGERDQLKKRGTDNPKAFEAYMRGRYFWNQFTTESFAKVIEAFQAAINLDPNYALPYVGIADFYNWTSIYGMMPPEEAHPKAREAALRALELDADLGEAYAALGLIASGQWDWAESERLYRKALELSPNYSLAHEWYGSLLVGTGRFEEGMKETYRAEELDPLSLRAMTLTAWNSYQAQRLNESLSKAQQIIDMDKNFPQGYIQRGNCLERMGRADEAVKALEKSIQLMPDSTLPHYLLCFALVAAGQQKRAREVLNEMKDRANRGYVKPYFIAMAHAALGERDAAFELFERAFAERDHWLLWFCTEPKLDPLRSDPRFSKLLRRLNNPMALRQTAITERTDESGERTIAVLPLKVLGARQSGDSDEYLGFGLADALITRLSKLGRFVVRPTSCVLRYSNHADAFTAGRELGAEFVVDGSIRNIAGRIRVTAQLLNVREGTTRWAEQFDEKQADVFELEDSISAKIVESLIPQLTNDTRLRLGKRATDNPEAYEAYLRGRFHWNTLTPEGFSKAVAFSERAIALDPLYATAYASLAEYYCWLAIFGLMSPGESLSKAHEAARRAVELDNHLAEGHTALGFALLVYEKRWREAERHHARAIELNPSYALARVWYADQLTAERRFDEADEESARSCALDPLNPFNTYNRAWCLYQARRFEDSIRLHSELARSDPHYSPAYFGLCWALRRTGAKEEAIRMARRAIETGGETPLHMSTLACAYAEAGHEEDARRVLASLDEQEAERFVTPYHRALIHLHLGERDEALHLLERSVTIGEPWAIWLGTEPQFDALRDEARFAELLRRINHPSTLAAG